MSVTLDWRAREALVHVGQWDDFVSVPVRRTRKERYRLVFLMSGAIAASWALLPPPTFPSRLSKPFRDFKAHDAECAGGQADGDI